MLHSFFTFLFNVRMYSFLQIFYIYFLYVHIYIFLILSYCFKSTRYSANSRTNIFLFKKKLFTKTSQSLFFLLRKIHSHHILRRKQFLRILTVRLCGLESTSFQLSIQWKIIWLKWRQKVALSADTLTLGAFFLRSLLMWFKVVSIHILYSHNNFFFLISHGLRIYFVYTFFHIFNLKTAKIF